MSPQVIEGQRKHRSSHSNAEATTTNSGRQPRIGVHRTNSQEVLRLYGLHAHDLTLMLHGEVETPRCRRPVADRTPVPLEQNPLTMFSETMARERLYPRIMLIVVRQDRSQVRQVSLTHMAKRCLPDVEPKSEHRPTALHLVRSTCHDRMLLHPRANSDVLRCVAPAHRRSRPKCSAPSLFRGHKDTTQCKAAQWSSTGVARHTDAYGGLPSAAGGTRLCVWGRWGSNPRPTDYESAALTG